MLLCWLLTWVLVLLRQMPHCLSCLLSSECDILNTYVLSLSCKVHIYCCGSVLALFIFSCELSDTAPMCGFDGLDASVSLPYDEVHVICVELLSRKNQFCFAI